MRFVRAALTVNCLAAAFAAADWDPASAVEVESQTWQTGNNPKGCVTGYSRDIVADLVGERVYLHMVYASCPSAVGGGPSYYIKYRRGYYDVASGPDSFTWDTGYTSGGQIISGSLTGRFKMSPTLAVTAGHRLYAFWADSSHCEETNGLWNNVEIYGSAAAFSPSAPPSWTWFNEPQRVSDGAWTSDMPVCVTDDAEPPFAHIFWRDGRDAAIGGDLTNIYTEAWDENAVHYPAGGQLLSTNGGLTYYGMYDVLDTRVDAFCDGEGYIHLVWADARAGTTAPAIYYKRRAPDGTWSADVCLKTVAGGVATDWECAPMICPITLPNGENPGGDICVMAHLRYGMANAPGAPPIMYVYNSGNSTWYYISVNNCAFGVVWRGALTSEVTNNVVHVLYPSTATGSPGNLLYRRGHVTTSAVTWDAAKTVYTTNSDTRFPSLTLDRNHVLHAFFHNHAAGTPEVATMYYLNDDGDNFVGP